MDILKRIYKLRVDRGWSEYQLAEASEIPQSTISSWYRKDMLPSIGSLEKICKGLGITVSQFFDDSNESGSLTDDQRRLLSGWERLTPGQRESLLVFLESL
jgi:transcriptional regulator with XRE-family HTH domain